MGSEEVGWSGHVSVALLAGEKEFLLVLKRDVFEVVHLVDLMDTLMVGLWVIFLDS